MNAVSSLSMARSIEQFNGVVNCDDISFSGWPEKSFYWAGLSLQVCCFWLDIASFCWVLHRSLFIFITILQIVTHFVLHISYKSTKTAKTAKRMIWRINCHEGMKYIFISLVEMLFEISCIYLESFKYSKIFK